MLRAAIIAAALAGLAPADAVSPTTKAERLIEAGDDAGARAALERPARNGSPEAAVLLATLLEEGRGGEIDLRRAIELYAFAAEQGSPQAEFALGRMARDGVGVPQDLQRAADWFALAAAKDHPPAQVALGRMHRDGVGAALDPVYAADLFELAAAAGDADGAFELALAYETGVGRAQSFANARRWYEAAAQKAHPEALYRTALLLEAGRGGPAEPERAERLMREAAEAGVPPAMTALGVMTLQKGAGLAPEAADWFERAAGAGEERAMFLLAVVYAQGRGRERDPGKAIEWIDASLAAAGDDLDARERDLRLDFKSALIIEQSGGGLVEETADEGAQQDAG